MGDPSPPWPQSQVTGKLLEIARQFRWPLLRIAVGDLISGILVFLIAPEAEGHGNDAMIEAFHTRGGYIRKRVPFVKIVASAITIGSGGSAGKEGPIAQIGAGFGSFLAGLFNLKARDVANPAVVTVSWHESLKSALDKIARLNVDELPVTQADKPEKIAGMISKRDIISYYHQRMSA